MQRDSLNTLRLLAKDAFPFLNNAVSLYALPIGAAPWIALGMLVSGVIVVFAISWTGREEWLYKAGAVYEGDVPQPAAAVGEPPGGPPPAGPPSEVG